MPPPRTRAPRPPKKETLDIQYTCQKCLRRKQTTRHRTFYTKNYMGPCGDSFCYASCDMDTCHPTSMTICEDCLKKLEKKK
jgi:hypothetical protein